jgi:hypothetical protein
MSNAGLLRLRLFIGIGFAFLPKKKLEVSHVFCGLHKLDFGYSIGLCVPSKHDSQKARQIILGRQAKTEKI